MYCNCEAKKLKNEKNIILVENKPYSSKYNFYVCECCQCDDSFYIKDSNNHLYCNDCANYCTYFNPENIVDYNEIMSNGNVITTDQIIYDDDE